MVEYKIIRLKDVMELTGLKRTSIYNRMSENTFPLSVSLGGRAVGWVLSEVTAWNLERINERK